VPAIRQIVAFPLQIGAARLGVLDAFRARPGHLSSSQLSDALRFAEAALTILLDGQENAATGAVAGGLAGAIEHRAELFQGMVMVQLGVSLAEALARISAHAYPENRHLSDVAADVLARRLRFDPDQWGPH
jgi:hypothetical protein